MTERNFSSGLFATSLARRSLREREPLGREAIGRERISIESRSARSYERPNRDAAAAPRNPAAMPATAAAAAAVDSLRGRIASRYGSGDAVRPSRASWRYDFPLLPADTEDREARFLAGEVVEPKVAFIHGYEQRPLLYGWRPFHDPFSSEVDAPAPVLDEEPSLLNPELGSGPFYGRYVGPVSRNGRETRAPLTPVDKAAYIHDKEYGEIYARYQYSEFEYGLSFSKQVDKLLGTNLAGTDAVYAFGWIGSHTSLDPAMQLELAWADTKLIGGSWAFLGEGLGKGFYAGGRGQRALITDLAWASAISVFYGAVLFWRLAMAGVGVVYQAGLGIAGAFKGLGKAIGGDVGKAVGWVGDLMGGAFDAAAHVFSFFATAAFTVYAIGAGIVAGVVGGLVYLGGKIIEGIGSVLGSVGNAIGKLFGGGGGGCFITEAVTRSVGRDDGTLSTLRRFRDQYMSLLPEGRRMILAYQEIAPRIVEAVEQGDGPSWSDIRGRWIDPAVEMIRKGREAEALRIYGEMVVDLARLFEIATDYDGSRFHWKRDPRLRTSCSNTAKVAPRRGALEPIPYAIGI